MTDWLNGGDWSLVGEFVEVETGTRSDRPQLKLAIEAARRSGAKLIIAKLDRLARNVAFISTLMESDVEFVALDCPTANKFTLHILAAVAEHEAQLISHAHQGGPRGGQGTRREARQSQRGESPPPRSCEAPGRDRGREPVERQKGRPLRRADSAVARGGSRATPPPRPRRMSSSAAAFAPLGAEPGRRSRSSACANGWASERAVVRRPCGRRS